MLTETWKNRARLLRIVDGDTFWLLVDLGYRMHHQAPIRLSEIDTNEIFGQAKSDPEYHQGLAQKEYAADWFAAAAQVWEKDRWPVAVTSLESGKYGRWVGELEMRGDPPTGYEASLQDSLRATFEEL